MRRVVITGVDARGMKERFKDAPESWEVRDVTEIEHRENCSQVTERFHWQPRVGLNGRRG